MHWNIFTMTPIDIVISLQRDSVAPRIAVYCLLRGCQTPTPFRYYRPCLYVVSFLPTSIQLLWLLALHERYYMFGEVLPYCFCTPPPQFCNASIESLLYVYLSGNAITTIKSNDPVKLMTIRGTAFAAAPADGGSTSPENGVYLFPIFVVFIVVL